MAQVLFAVGSFVDEGIVGYCDSCSRAGIVLQACRDVLDMESDDAVLSINVGGGGGFQLQPTIPTEKLATFLRRLWVDGVDELEVRVFNEGELDVVNDAKGEWFAQEVIGWEE